MQWIKQTVTNMTNHNSANTTTTVHDDVSANIDVPTVDSPIFEDPWPWLERFGVTILRSWHPSCSFWVATCTFLPLMLSFYGWRSLRVSWLSTDHKMKPCQ
jgi:hypothetical protein